MIDLILYLDDKEIRALTEEEVNIILNYRKIFANYYNLKNMVYVVMQNYNEYNQFLKNKIVTSDDIFIMNANKIIINLLGSIYSLCEIFKKKDNLFSSGNYDEFKNKYYNDEKIQTLIWIRHAIIHHSLLLTHIRNIYPYFRLSLLDIEQIYEFIKSSNQSERKKDINERVYTNLKKQVKFLDYDIELHNILKSGISALEEFCNIYSNNMYKNLENKYKNYCKLRNQIIKEIKSNNKNNQISNNNLKCESKSIKTIPIILDDMLPKEKILDVISTNKNNFIKELFSKYKDL